MSKFAIDEKTLRTSKVVLPLKYIAAVVQPRDPEDKFMYPRIEVSDDTVLVVRLRGKKVEKALLQMISELQSLPRIPPPPSSTPSSSKPLLDLEGL